MAAGRRTFKVAEKIRGIVALELQRVADPRFSMVTITSVMVSADLRFAKVYWTVTGGQERRSEVEQAFSSAAGLFKRGLSKELGLRYSPELRFFYDDTLDTNDEVERLFARVHAQEHKEDVE